jgi:hypothetical protein
MPSPSPPPRSSSISLDPGPERRPDPLLSFNLELGIARLDPPDCRILGLVLETGGTEDIKGKEQDLEEEAVMGVMLEVAMEEVCRAVRGP